MYIQNDSKILKDFPKFENQIILITKQKEPKPIKYHPNTDTYSIVENLLELDIYDFQYTADRKHWFSSASEPEFPFQFAALKKQ